MGDAAIDKGLVLQLQATSLLLVQQLREAQGGVDGYANKAVASLKRVEDSSRKTGAAITVSAGQQQNAIKNLGFQFNDFLTQVQGGSGVLRAFAQQSGQAAGALADMGGKAGAVGRFFSGILGGGILAAGTALLSYLLTMSHTDEVTDSAIVSMTDFANSADYLKARLEGLNAEMEKFTTPRQKLFEDLAKLKTDIIIAEGDAKPRAVQRAGHGVARIDITPTTEADRLLTAQQTLAQLRLRERSMQQQYDAMFAKDNPVAKPKKTAVGRKFTPMDIWARKIGYDDYADFERSVEQAKTDLKDPTALLDVWDPKQTKLPVYSGTADLFPEFSAKVQKFNNTALDAKMNLNSLVEDTPRVEDTPLGQFFTDIQRDAANMGDVFSQVETDGLRDLNGGLADAIAHSKSLGDVFEQVGDRIIAKMIEIGLEQAELKLFGGGSGGSGGGFGSFFSSIGLSQVFGGGVTPTSASLDTSAGFADGGRPPVGVPSWVGERGKELFVPDVPGTIIPNHRLDMLGGNSQAISIAVDARGATDPVMVEQAAYRAVAAAAPSLLAMAQGRTTQALARPSLPTSLG